MPLRYRHSLGPVQAADVYIRLSRSRGVVLGRRSDSLGRDRPRRSDRLRSGRARGRGHAGRRLSRRQQYRSWRWHSRQSAAAELGPGHLRGGGRCECRRPGRWSPLSRRALGQCHKAGPHCRTQHAGQHRIYDELSYFFFDVFDLTFEVLQPNVETTEKIARGDLAVAIIRLVLIEKTTSREASSRWVGRPRRRERPKPSSVTGSTSKPTRPGLQTPHSHWRRSLIRPHWSFRAAAPWARSSVACPRRSKSAGLFRT